MSSLFQNIRFYVLAFSISFSLVIAAFLQVTIETRQLQIIRIEQVYAFTALTFLYFTLLIGPLFYTFKTLPFREEAKKARRALGVSAFYFACLHAIFAFFGQLNGFSGLAFLGIDFLIPVILGLTALTILFVLALTSFDLVIQKIGVKNLKLLQYLIYIAGILILVHMVLLGTHFGNLRSIIPQIVFFALTFLLVLETIRIDNYLQKYIVNPRFGITTGVMVIIAAGFYFAVINPFASQSNPVSFDIHAAHKQLAQIAAQQNQNSNQKFAVDISKLPGLDGDRTKRYTVSMSTDPANPLPNQDVTIHFKIYDATSGNPVNYFKFIYAKKMHLIIVNSNLSYFTHIHPEQDDQGFSITTQFPANDVYHIYIEYQPFGGIEQQTAFSVPVGNVEQTQPATQSAKPDITTKTFGKYEVTMNTNGQLSASDMTFGNQKISFTVKDAKTHKPITTLKPYLATFGHLTMINESTYNFIHVHPYSLVVPPPNANGGPTVDFLPIGIYGSFKPGIYRVFAEFNPDNNLFTADFTVKLN